MTTSRTFDEQLISWLGEGPEAAPPGLLDEVLAAAASVAPRERLRRGIGWQFERQAFRWGFVLLATVAVLFVASILFVPGPPAPLIPVTPSPNAATAPAVLRSPVPDDTLPTPFSSEDLPQWQPCVARMATPTVSPGFEPGVVAGLITFRAGSEIAAIDPAASDHRVVIAESLGANPIGWSRDGASLLLLASRLPSLNGTYLLTAAGSLTSLTQEPIWGSLAPDGQRVVINVPGGGLCVLTTDGRAATPLALDFGEPLDEASTAWSPDGARVAFLDFVEDSPVYGHHAFGLSFIDADGHNLEQLKVPLTIDEGGGGLVWSPDGTRLALWLPSAEGEVGQIYVLDADGTNFRQLMASDADDRWPAWSPDGTRLAFVRRPEVGSATSELYVVNADGSHLQVVNGVQPAGPIAWNAGP